MLPLIDAISVAIHEKKDLSSLMRVSIFNLPKQAFVQRIFTVFDRSIIRPISTQWSIALSSSTIFKTNRCKNKELIVQVLGGDVYHTIKVNSYIKNKTSLSDSEFIKLKRRCDKIRSNRVLLGVFIEIMYKQSHQSFLTQQQLKTLSASFPTELNQLIVKAFQAYKKNVDHVDEKIVQEMLFVLQTLYDYNNRDINFKKPTRENVSVSTEDWSLVTLADKIDSCLERVEKIEKQLFSNDHNQRSCKEAILQAVDLSCLSSSLSVRQY